MHSITKFTYKINNLRRLLSTNSYSRVLDIYTDGSCIDNGTKYAKGGIGVYFPNSEYYNLSEPYDVSEYNYPATSQRCELVAIHKALQIHFINFSYMKCRIYTDSEYAIQCMVSYGNVWRKNGWKKTNGQQVKNIDLLEPLINQYKKNSDKINLVYVRAHTNERTTQALNNSIADALAKRGVIQHTVYPQERIISDIIHIPDI